MSFVGSNILAGASGQGGSDYQIDRSLRFDSSSSSYLSRTPSSGGNRRTWTLSYWVKRTTLNTEVFLFSAAGSSSDRVHSYFGSNNLFALYSHNWYYTTSIYSRDPSAWQHHVIACDTTQATDTNRVKIYINGVLQDSANFNNVLHPAQNLETTVNSAVNHQFSGRGYMSLNYLDAYLAECILVDGQQLDCTSFGKFDDNNNWIAKRFSGPFGTNGFKLNFSDAASTTTIAEDSSGNSNHFTATNISVSSGAGNDSLFDTPTNYTPDSGNTGGNYATLNSIDKKSTVTLSNGNLDVTTSSTGWAGVKGTIGASSGKYYFEATANGSAANYMFFGICASNVKLDTSGYLQDDSTERAKGMLIFCDNGQYQLDGNSRVNYSSSMANGDVIAVAYDLDGNTVQFYKNGSALGSIDISGSPLASATVVPLYIHYNTNTTYHLNFGQRSFTHTPPTNYLSLVTTNLSEPVIADPSTAFDVALWTGNGGTQTISGLNLSPDFLWIKNRSSSYNHHLLDTVRGANNGQNVLYSNLTNAEGSTNSVTAFTSDGFTVGSNSAVNHNSAAIVGWAWDAGTSTVSNTDGSITSSVRASQTNGMSIASYTGNNAASASIGHSLNAKPGVIFVKRRGTAGNDWAVYHSALGATKNIDLNNTDGASTTSETWNNTEPTTSVFTVGTSDMVNAADTYIAYCFAPVEGFSAFGSYEGNGSNTDGAFVYTGFQPRWIMIKNIDNSGSGYDWFIFDTKRSQYNVTADILKANLDAGEYSFNSIDILSNGFKIRRDTNGINLNAHTHVWAAFAAHPFSLNGGLAR